VILIASTMNQPAVPLIIGDCHTMVFRQAKTLPCQVAHVGPITADAFCRRQSPMRRLLDQLILQAGGVAKRTVVLSISEIDIRSHFWRDIPILLARGMSLPQFVQRRVEGYLSEVRKFIEETGASRVVLWGPPASLLGQAPHNDEFPTVGSNRTRNLLTHVFNHCLATAVAPGKGDQIGFASMFYDMIYDDFTSNSSWIPDAIHIPDDRVTDCCERLDPAINGTPLSLGLGMSTVPELAVEITVTPYERPHRDSPREFFKNWLLTESTAESITITGQAFTFVSDASVANDAFGAMSLGLQVRPVSQPASPP